MNDPRIERLMAERRRVLGPGMRLSYERPVHLASAEGVWFTTVDGERLLDAYNNVAHVGHGRPEVVAALADQAQRLNTNTRYLIDGVIEYAGRIGRLLPDPLEVVMFANSGSEANDLAWRIARTVTGRQGMIVTEHAYHGATDLTMATSPEELRGVDPEPWVATVPAPATYGGPHSGEEAGLEYAAHLDQAIDGLDERGHRPAGFACDTVFASDGIYDAPHGYFVEAFLRIRETGGLAIADEVQGGFGRVGRRMWGFAADDVVPDIVTLGKPMGNGHPVAAVVTTAAIAEAFTERGYYFSTFAGNPVSAAVGMAVLDVMESEELPSRAERVGEYLRAGLGDVATRFPEIRDVRGPGLFVGVELSNEALTTRVVNGMRDRGVLIGRTGIRDNVLKIRPPLVFVEEHADLVVTTLEETLGAVG